MSGIIFLSINLYSAPVANRTPFILTTNLSINRETSLRRINLPNAAINVKALSFFLDSSSANYSNIFIKTTPFVASRSLYKFFI